MSGLGWALLAAQLVPLVWRRRAPVIVAVTAALRRRLVRHGHRLAGPAADVRPVAGHLHAGGVPAPAHLGPDLRRGRRRARRSSSCSATSRTPPTSRSATSPASRHGSSGDTMRTQRERAAWMAARRVEDAQRSRDDRSGSRSRATFTTSLRTTSSVIAVQAEAAQEVLLDAARASGAGDGGRRRHRAHCAHRVAPAARSAALRSRPCAAARTRRDRRPRRRPYVAQGSTFELSRAGRDGPVDAVAGLTAYRVVQEALTNVMKHAGPCTDRRRGRTQ